MILFEISLHEFSVAWSCRDFIQNALVFHGFLRETITIYDTSCFEQKLPFQSETVSHFLGSAPSSYQGPIPVSRAINPCPLFYTARYESLDEVKEIIDAWRRRFFISRRVITVHRLKLQMRNVFDVDKRNLLIDFSSTTFPRWSKVKRILWKNFHVVFRWFELDYFYENGVFLLRNFARRTFIAVISGGDRHLHLRKYFLMIRTSIGPASCLFDCASIQTKGRLNYGMRVCIGDLCLAYLIHAVIRAERISFVIR